MSLLPPLTIRDCAGFGASDFAPDFFAFFWLVLFDLTMIHLTCSIPAAHRPPGLHT